MIKDMKSSPIRSLSLWLASYLVVAVLLFFYAGVSLLPILIAGLLTLGVTLFRLWRRP